MIPLALFVTAFLVRAAVGAAFPAPAYPDSYYYANVAQQLAAGHGFSIDYIWNFVDVGGRLPAVPTLPIPANAHWMPLAEVIQVPFIWLLGPNWLAADLPFWIVGALAAPLAYWIGRDSGFGRGTSAGAGLLVAVPGGLTPYLSQPDNFGLFMTLGALSLWLCARGMRGDRRAFVLGGLVVGLATLARSDGILLGLPFALIGLGDLWHRDRARVGLVAATGCALAFALVAGPWFVRQLVVFGSIAPSASSGRILWLTDYDQLFSVGDAPTLATWLGQGLGPLLASRAGGLAAALGLFALLPLVAVLAPFALIGAWLRRRSAALWPFFVYAAALFAASGLVFAVHVPHGTFIHSAAALLPYTFLLVVAGVAGTVEWAARRRPKWNTARATVAFTAAAVVVALAGATVQTISTVGHWTEIRRVQQDLVSALAEAPATDVVMAADPGAVRYLSGHPGIVTPNDPLPTIEQAMRDYNVRWLLLESGQIVPALAPVLTGDIVPAWLSRPVAVVALATVAVASTAPKPTLGPALGALYAVCLTPADTRCAP
jgi:4-amino-4-deoxy-L-arabinose transferase-like glycosyltransferase